MKIFPIVSTIIIFILFLITTINLISVNNIRFNFGVKSTNDELIIYKTKEDYNLQEIVLTYDPITKKSNIGEISSINEDEYTVRDLHFTRNQILGEKVFSFNVLNLLFRFSRTGFGVVAIFFIPLVGLLIYDKYKDNVYYQLHAIKKRVQRPSF